VSRRKRIEGIEKLPLKGGTAKLKPLADAARPAARERFEALQEDPAYHGTVNDSCHRTTL
jgi:hypothetical protein